MKIVVGCNHCAWHEPVENVSRTAVVGQVGLFCVTHLEKHPSHVVALVVS